jgi:nifR3 family TIM-barrel protein
MSFDTVPSPIRPIKIGNVTVKNNLALAPMAGITNSAFRRLAAEGGAGLVVTEMVSAESIKYGNRKSFKMLELYPGEMAAVQVFGADPASMALAARAAADYGAAIIDINAGCPVKKVTRNGAGSALMGNPVLFGRIIEAAAKAVKIPVTVKFRVGLRPGEICGPELAKIAESSGAAAITLHGRYASAMHSGPVDMDAVAASAAAVRIPVYGNGGITDAAGVKAFLEAGCKGAAIGRASVYNPMIFREIVSAFSGGAEHVSTSERLDLFIRYLRLNTELYGEIKGLATARKLVGYWLKGVPGAAAARMRFMTLTELSEAEALVRGLIT